MKTNFVTSIRLYRSPYGVDAIEITRYGKLGHVVNKHYENPRDVARLYLLLNELMTEDKVKVTILNLSQPEKNLTKWHYIVLEPVSPPAVDDDENLADQFIMHVYAVVARFQRIFCYDPILPHDKQRIRSAVIDKYAWEDRSFRGHEWSEVVFSFPDSKHCNISPNNFDVLEDELHKVIKYDNY